MVNLASFEDLKFAVKWDILSHFQTMWGSSKEYKKGQRDTFQDILGLASSKGKKSWATTSWNNGLFKQIILPTFITRRNSKAACRTQQMQFVFFQRLSHNFSIKFLVFSIFFLPFTSPEISRCKLYMLTWVEFIEWKNNSKQLRFRGLVG